MLCGRISVTLIRSGIWSGQSQEREEPARVVWFLVSSRWANMRLCQGAQVRYPISVLLGRLEGLCWEQSMIWPVPKTGAGAGRMLQYLESSHGEQSGKGYARKLRWFSRWSLVERSLWADEFQRGGKVRMRSGSLESSWGVTRISKVGSYASECKPRNSSYINCLISLVLQFILVWRLYGIYVVFSYGGKYAFVFLIFKNSALVFNYA